METQRLEIAENHWETAKQRMYHFATAIWKQISVKQEQRVLRTGCRQQVRS